MTKEQKLYVIDLLLTRYESFFEPGIDLGLCSLLFQLCQLQYISIKEYNWIKEIIDTQVERRNRWRIVKKTVWMANPRSEKGFRKRIKFLKDLKAQYEKDS